ncbi:MAG: OmpH family outer membrane protein [Flavobacteriales bacterium]|nr:OmpH family outer membrane protein [Flavobacteriales bacterium]MCB9193688.1 OmpH family outer membrane protein [Flavobacteriales bacterium]
MNRKLGYLLLIWNVALSLLVGWGLTRGAQHDRTVQVAPSMDAEPARSTVPARPDSIGSGPLRIAYFFMDSVQNRYELVKEKGEHFRREGQRLQSNLQGELSKAQKRYDELTQKDHTYSTNAEIEADQRELQGLVGRIQDLQSQGEQRMQDLEVKMLSEISDEIMDFLKEYNSAAGYDYIFSVQTGGQIWVGNKGLDITNEVVDGLNARHRANRADSTANKH